jgi:CheY-like chemotaxis protein
MIASLSTPSNAGSFVVSSVSFVRGTLDRTPTPIALFREGSVLCHERDRIAEQFIEAVRAYSEAVNGLRALRGSQFKQHQQLVEQTRTACEAVRTSLQDHEHQHGCTRADTSREPGLSVHDPSSTVILLAEDEVVIRNLLGTMLTKQGYKVLTASDGLEAMEVCKKFSDPIQLLITNVTMPRMDGLALTTKVREERPDIRVIVISGQTNADILDGNRPDAFLRKPFQPVTILKAVQDILDRRNSATVDH